MRYTSSQKPFLGYPFMDAFKKGVNSTSVDVVYCAAGSNDRAVLIVTLRPGKIPTDEAHEAIQMFLDALKALQSIRDV
jgi:hypothetical protein